MPYTHFVTSVDPLFDVPLSHYLTVIENGLGFGFTWSVNMKIFNLKSLISTLFYDSRKVTSVKS